MVTNAIVPWTGRRRQRLTDSRRKISIHHAAKIFDGLAGERVARLDLQRLLKLFSRATDQSFREIDASQIEVGKMPGIVSLRRECLLEPGDRFVKTFEVDEVGANIVVRIAKFRIDSDRQLAFGDGLLDFSLKVVRPAKKRVSLCGGMERDGSLI